MTREIAKRAGTEVDIALPDRLAKGPNSATLHPPVGVRPLVLMLYALGIFFFLGLGTWAARSQIHSAVVATAEFRADGDVQVVQHFDGGIVREIHIRDGEHVNEGDTIAVLDGTRNQAQIGLFKIQLANALARQARFIAEYNGSDEFEIGHELQALLDENPEFQEVITAQQTMFETNRNTDAGQTQIFAEMAEQLTRQRDGLAERLTNDLAQLELIREDLAGMNVLFEKGLTTRQRIIARSQNEAAIAGQIAELRGDMLAAEEQITEYRERTLQVERDRRSLIAENLEVLQSEIFDVRQRLLAAKKIAEDLVIRAPISGVVVGFELNTLGSVVAPGATLLRIVPDDTDYVVRGQVAPADIDEISVGQEARVRLLAYSFRKTPPVNGRVTYISADALKDPATEIDYFEVFVELDEGALEAVPNVKPTLSMPAQVMITTGQATILTYILDPIIGNFETALLETE